MLTIYSSMAVSTSKAIVTSFEAITVHKKMWAVQIDAGNLNEWSFNLIKPEIGTGKCAFLYSNSW
jgi:hypothetical protein